MALESNDRKYHRLMHKRFDREYADVVEAKRNRVTRLLRRIGKVNSSSESSAQAKNVLTRESLINAA